MYFSKVPIANVYYKYIVEGIDYDLDSKEITKGLSIDLKGCCASQCFNFSKRRKTTDKSYVKYRFLLYQGFGIRHFCCVAL